MSETVTGHYRAYLAPIRDFWLLERARSMKVAQLEVRDMAARLLRMPHI